MAKKKILGVLSIFLFIGIISTALSARATNPEHFDFDFDDDTKNFSLYIIHGVTDPEKHYVNNLLVILTDHTLSVNTTIANDNFTSQETYNIIHFNYTVLAADWGENSSVGDDIFVKATCNLGGVFIKTKHLHPTPPGHEFEFSSVVPAFFAGAIIASGFALLPMLMKENRAKQSPKFKLPKLKKKHVDK